MNTQRTTPAILIASLLLATTGGACLAQAPAANAKAEAAVRAAMDQFAKAVLAKDKGTLEKLMGDAILYSHSNGKLDTKASFINDVMNETPKYEGFAYGDTKILIYGNTAVVRGAITVKDVLNGQRRTIELNALQIWVEKGGHWTMVARQSTRLNP